MSFITTAFNWVVTKLQRLPIFRRKTEPPRPELRQRVAPAPPEAKPTEEDKESAAQARARLERARKKYDKFLPIPVGASPARSSSTWPRVPKEKPPEIATPDSAAVSIWSESGIGSDKIVVQDTINNEQVLVEQGEMKGDFNFRDTILDQLDFYFMYLKRMKKRDHGAYDLYRHIGAVICPYASPLMNAHKMDQQFLRSTPHYFDKDDDPQHQEKLPEKFRRLMPSFGCFAFGADHATEEMEQQLYSEEKRDKVCWIPKFLYFTKYEAPPPEVQQCGGVVYKVTVWWDRPFDPKVASHLKGGGIPQDYAVVAGQDGSVRALRILMTDPVWVEAKHKNFKKQIPVKRWQIPKFFSLDEKEKNSIKLQNLFCKLALAHEWQLQKTVLVSVSKGGLTARFSINPEKSAYFFKDRDLVIDIHGAKKRIFHAVRSHIRETGSEVKQHYRGLRKFKWAGYEVLITIPGIHHRKLEEIDFGCLDPRTKQYKQMKRRGVAMIEEDEIGKRLGNMMRKGASHDA